MANGKQYGKRLGRAVKRRVAGQKIGKGTKFGLASRKLPLTLFNRPAKVPTQAQEVRRFMRKAQEG